MEKGANGKDRVRCISLTYDDIDKCICDVRHVGFYCFSTMQINNTFCIIVNDKTTISQQNYVVVQLFFYIVSKLRGCWHVYI